MGECFVKGTVVLTEQGLVPIEEVEKGDTVYSQEGKRRVRALYEMPKRELRKITLENGISVTATASQKFKVLSKKLAYEWKKADELDGNDHLVIKAEYPEIKEYAYLGELGGRMVYLDEDVGYLLGQLLSDGWVEKGCRRGYPFRCGFCSSSQPVMERISRVLADIFDYHAAIEERNYEYETGDGQLLLKTMHTVRINSSVINELLVSAFSLQGAYAETKEIPPQVLRSPKSVVYAFISGLVDGDGSIHADRNSIHYGSVSEKMIDTLQILLQHLGIMSTRYVEMKHHEREVNGRRFCGNYPFHYLEVRSRFARLLVERLQLSDERKSARTQEQKDSVKVSRFDEIPYAGEVIFSELSRTHLGSGWYQDANGNKFRKGVKYKGGTKIRYSCNLKALPLGRSQIEEWGIAEKLDKIGSPLSEFVNGVLQNGIYFLKIEKVETAAPEKTYDIRVEGEHEFIANGIVSHNCLGKFHPHGDTAVYDALVRMAQDFSLRYPLIEGQGNFGSIDADAAAAMRYTEARLAKISDQMLQDIDKETVKFTDNFDGTLKEPSVLPAKIPNLLINGSSGIAVGMATNIPPHNLKEVCTAVIRLIENPAIELEELMTIIKGPDFPTGAIISGRAGIKEAYSTGRGKIIVTSKIEEERKKDKVALVIKEIPYQTNKSQLVEEIADNVREKKIEGVSDLRDESDREGLRIVLDLKQGANVEIVKNQLLKNTRAKDTFGIIFLCIIDNEPKVLPLKSLLHEFLHFRQQVVRKRTEYDLKKAEEKAHVLEGLIICIDNIDAVIDLLKKAKTPGEAKLGLMQKYKLTEIQSQAILDMRLARLTGLEREKIKSEHKEILELIKRLKEILADEQKILGIIKQEMKELIEKFGDNRKTVIGEEKAALEIEDLIVSEDQVITLSNLGYIKRMPIQSYRVQSRGGKGIIGTTPDENDFIERVFIGNTHSYLLCFTDQGMVYWLKVYKIPEASRYSKGKAIVNLVELDEGEKISSVIAVKEFKEGNYLVMATRKGIFKKTDITAYSNPRAGGIKAITLDIHDSLIDVELTDNSKYIVLGTKKGLAVKFPDKKVRPIGRTSKGVIGVRLDKEDEVIGMMNASDEEKILTVTENGYGKKTELKEYRLTNRGGKGVINIQCSERNGTVVAIMPVTDTDEIICMSKNGIAIRIPSAGISTIGRNTQGVRIMKLDESDKVVSVAKIASENGKV
ncbi:MAG: DNA gyrase subunit A [Nanoarchaeota archaeon]